MVIKWISFHLFCFPFPEGRRQSSWRELSSFVHTVLWPFNVVSPKQILRARDFLKVCIWGPSISPNYEEDASGELLFRVYRYILKTRNLSYRALSQILKLILCNNSKKKKKKIVTERGMGHVYEIHDLTERYQKKSWE